MPSTQRCFISQKETWDFGGTFIESRQCCFVYGLQVANKVTNKRCSYKYSKGYKSHLPQRITKSTMASCNDGFPKMSKWSNLLLRPWRILFAGGGPEGFLKKCSVAGKSQQNLHLTVRIGKKWLLLGGKHACWRFWTAILDWVINLKKSQRHAVHAYRAYGLLMRIELQA